MSKTQKSHRRIMAIVGSHANSGYNVEVTEVDTTAKEGEVLSLPRSEFVSVKYTDLDEAKAEALKQWYDDTRRAGIFFPAKFTKTTATFELGAKFEVYSDPMIRPFLSVNDMKVMEAKKISLASGKGKSQKVVKVNKKVRVVRDVCKFKDGFIVSIDRAGNALHHLSGKDTKALRASIAEYSTGEPLEVDMGY